MGKRIYDHGTCIVGLDGTCFGSETFLFNWMAGIDGVEGCHLGRHLDADVAIAISLSRTIGTDFGASEPSYRGV